MNYSVFKYSAPDGAEDLRNYLSINILPRWGDILYFLQVFYTPQEWNIYRREKKTMDNPDRGVICNLNYVDLLCMRTFSESTM